MSSSSAMGSSASGSLPQNLGVGLTANAANKAKGKEVHLSKTDKDAMEMHLTIVRKLFSVTNPPSEEELKALSKYATSLIEDYNTDDVIEALKGKIKDGNINHMEKGVNSFALFVAKMKKDHLGVAILEEKFKQGATLDFDECYLVDELGALSLFVEKMHDAKITDNKHVNAVYNVNTAAKANAFREYQDGDVLFYDVYARDNYNRNKMGFFLRGATSAMVNALGTQYCHVGVFYREPDGKPCVTEIQGGFERHYLSFGQQTYIKGKRVDPGKFTGMALSEAERLEAQKKLGDIFSNITAGKNWKIGITNGQQLACVFGHTTDEANTQLGKVKIQNNTDMLCSEFAGKGLMEAFHQFNTDKPAIGKDKKVIALSNPFSGRENMEHLHPERLLDAFGPNQGTDQADSGWEDVKPLSGEGILLVAKMLPAASRFPDLSYPKKAAA